MVADTISNISVESTRFAFQAPLAPLTSTLGVIVMSLLQQAIDRLSLSVQPLVFETGSADYPYSTKGTVFLVGYEGKPYVLTARHALNPECPIPICVFPSDTSHRLIPLDDVFFVPRTEVDEDFVDLAAISIDIKNVTHPEVAQATLIDLALACGEWQESTEDVQFFIIGYPEERSFINDETQEIRTDRVVLFGRYGGPSPLQHLHLFHVSDSLSLSTFSGFSGGPVFAWMENPDQRPVPVLCGMALRGTPASGLIHFLDRQMLLDALAVKRCLEQKRTEE